MLQELDEVLFFTFYFVMVHQAYITELTSLFLFCKFIKSLDTGWGVFVYSRRMRLHREEERFVK